MTVCLAGNALTVTVPVAVTMTEEGGETDVSVTVDRMTGLDADYEATYTLAGDIPTGAWGLLPCSQRGHPCHCMPCKRAVSRAGQGSTCSTSTSTARL